MSKETRSAKDEIDVTDLRILRELQADSSLSNVALAKRVNLSPSPCLTRVRRLEELGLIREYVALLDPAQLGLKLNVFISVSLKDQNRASLQEFESRVCAREEIMECYLMTGESDYLLRVATTDIEALERLIIEQLSPIPGVEKIRSSLALKQVRYKTSLPLATV